MGKIVISENVTLDGVEKEEEDIFPDPMSASMAVSWRGSAAKAMERQLASFVQAA